jgi:uncharacterized cupin superfamily protein
MRQSTQEEHMPNIYSPLFDEPREQPGFSCRRARIGRQAHSERVGASLWEIHPGQAAYPYHYHLAEEELVIVLAGSPRLRTREGWRELREGDVVGFPTGEHGAHQLVNDTDQPVRFLAVSNQQPDIVIRPDSGTLGAFERRPVGGGLYKHFRLADAVDYFEGESAPPLDRGPR